MNKQIYKGDRVKVINRETNQIEAIGIFDRLYHEQDRIIYMLKIEKGKYDWQIGQEKSFSNEQYIVIRDDVNDNRSIALREAWRRRKESGEKFGYYKRELITQPSQKQLWYIEDLKRRGAIDIKYEIQYGRLSLSCIFITNLENILIKNTYIGHLLIGRSGGIISGSIYKSSFSNHSEKKVNRYSTFLIYMELPHEDVGY